MLKMKSYPFLNLARSYIRNQISGTRIFQSHLMNFDSIQTLHFLNHVMLWIRFSVRKATKQNYEPLIPQTFSTSFLPNTQDCTSQCEWSGSILVVDPDIKPQQTYLILGRHKQRWCTKKGFIKNRYEVVIKNSVDHSQWRSVPLREFNVVTCSQFLCGPPTIYPSE